MTPSAGDHVPAVFRVPRRWRSSRPAAPGRGGRCGEDMPVADAQKDQEDARELRKAAARLRVLVPRFREVPGTEFVPMAVAGLLEAIADCVGRSEPLRDSVRMRALEIAHHVPSTPPAG